MALRERLRPRSMLALFLGAMAVFASGTAWLAWRFVQQDRAVQQQQIVERLERVADLAAAELRQRIAGLEARLEALNGAASGERREAAAALAADLPSDALLVLAEPRGISAFPPGRLVYQPDVRDVGVSPDGTFAEGESYEFRLQDYGRAMDAYGQHVGARDDRVRAGALLRLARVYRKAGRVEDALAAYEDLTELGDTPVDGLPAELLARHARCALLASQSRRAELRREGELLRAQLLAGAWTIDRGAFIEYVGEAEAFIRTAGGSGTEVETHDDRPQGLPPEARSAMALAAAAQELWMEWSDSDGRRLDRGTGDIMAAAGRSSREIDGIETLLLWRQSGDATVGLVLGPEAMSEKLIAALRPFVESQGVALRLVDRTGRVTREIRHSPAPPRRQAGEVSPLSVPEPPSERDAIQERPLRARRTSAESGLPWELHVVSADPQAEGARFAARRRLLLTVSAFAVLLIGAGTYFSARAVARELAVARLQSEFVSAVSHDFRTPLTSLRQVTEALLGGRVAEDRRHDYYEIQRRGIDRLHRLVEGLLDFGRMEAGAREFEARPFEARPWIERVVGDFRREVDKQGYTIELSWDADAHTVVGDEPALGRALWNLLDNAVKYSPDSRTVRVACRAAEGGDKQAAAGIWNGGVARYLAIAVRDRGLGIDPAERGEIFQKFVRGSASRAGSSSGTGLGLAMVAHIVEAHGGHVGVDSAPGDGSTFTMYLPIGGSS